MGPPDERSITRGKASNATYGPFGEAIEALEHRIDHDVDVLRVASGTLWYYEVAMDGLRPRPRRAPTNGSAAFLFVAAACNASSAPPTMEQACNAYVVAAGQRETVCYGVVPETNRDAIEARELQVCVLESDAPGSNVTPPFWDSCATLASDYCQGYSCPVPPGNRENGQPCLEADQCASLWCKGTIVVGPSGAVLDDAAQCGACAARLLVGEPCDVATDACESGLSCFQGACRATGQQGAPCVQWSDCSSPWVCRSNGVCGPVLGLGATCTASTDCATDEGCDAQTNVCVSIVFAQALAACDGNVNRCESGLCDVEPGASSGFCPQVLPDGSPCNPDDSSTVCDLYAACFAGVCQIVDPSTCIEAAAQDGGAALEAGSGT